MLGATITLVSIAPKPAEREEAPQLSVVDRPQMKARRGFRIAQGPASQPARARGEASRDSKADSSSPEVAYYYQPASPADSAASTAKGRVATHGSIRR